MGEVKDHKEIGQVMICDKCNHRNALGLGKCEKCGYVLMPHREWTPSEW